MATSALSGSGSVIDVQSIVSQLMQLEARPLQVIQQRSKAVDVQISAFSEVKSIVDSLAASASAMQDRTMLAGKTVSSSDDTLMKASVSNASLATTGSYAIKDTTLASSQRTMFAGFKDPSIKLGDEAEDKFNLSIESSPGSRFDFDRVEIALGGRSLNEIRDEINRSAVLQGVVKASIMNTGDFSAGAGATDGKGYVLVLTGVETGETASFSATWTDSVGDEDFLYGNPDGNYTPDEVLVKREQSANGAEVISRSLNDALNVEGAPRDATANVNGVVVKSRTNVFSEALPGLSFEVLKPSNSTVSITTKDNRDQLKERIRKFAQDLTSVNKKLVELAKQKSDTSRGGDLAGNNSVVSLSLSISSAYMRGLTVTDGSPTQPQYTWSKFGLEYARDGTVSLNESVFSEAINSSEGAVLMSSGFSSAVLEILKPPQNRFSGIVGSLSSTLDVLRGTKSRLDSSALDTQLRLDKTRARLLAKYASLDAKLAGMQQLSANVRSTLGG